MASWYSLTWWSMYLLRFPKNQHNLSYDDIIFFRGYEWQCWQNFLLSEKVKLFIFFFEFHAITREISKSREMFILSLHLIDACTIKIQKSVFLGANCSSYLSLLRHLLKIAVYISICLSSKFEHSNSTSQINVWSQIVIRL